MVSHIPRSLTYNDSSGHHTIVPEEILGLTGPIVILGEPGAGKTYLMRWLGASEGKQFISAKALLRKSKPADLLLYGDTLVIDGLDEVASAREEDPLQDVLEKLDSAGRPNFILSCRVADWQGAASQEDIAADYGTQPTVLYLSRLTSAEAIQHLSLFIVNDNARKAIEQLEEHGLSSLYGNPLTLSFIREILESGSELPNSRAALFETACNLL